MVKAINILNRERNNLGVSLAFGSGRVSRTLSATSNYETVVADATYCPVVASLRSTS